MLGRQKLPSLFEEEQREREREKERRKRQKDGSRKTVAREACDRVAD